MFLFLFLLVMCLRLHGVTGVGSVEVSGMEGYSVTLNTGVQKNRQDRIKWYFNNTLIALITGDLSNICTDVQCNEGNWRFRGRLKLDHQTGSLTIRNIRNTDSGEYTLQIISRRGSDSEKIFIVSVHDVWAFDTEVSVSVKEGDSVTLNTGVQTDQQELIGWFFNDLTIAAVRYFSYNSYNSTYVEYNDDDERFTDRLKLDNQTGSLTIMNIRNTDSGKYTAMIISSSRRSDKTFFVSVHGVSGVDTEVSVKEGDSVTLNTGVQTNQQDRIKWYYNVILIALINGDLSNICTDVQCNEDTERFVGRLELDHQTGSLTITHTTDTDSGEYTLQIISRRGSDSEKIFSVYVDAFSGPDPVPDPGPTPDPFQPGIYVAVTVTVASVAVLLFVAVICCCKRRARRTEANRTNRNTQACGAEDSSPDQRDTLMMKTLSDSNLNQTEAATETST